MAIHRTIKHILLFSFHLTEYYYLLDKTLNFGSVSDESPLKLEACWSFSCASEYERGRRRRYVTWTTQLTLKIWDSDQGQVNLNIRFTQRRDTQQHKRTSIKNTFFFFFDNNEWMNEQQMTKKKMNRQMWKEERESQIEESQKQVSLMFSHRFYNLQSCVTLPDDGKHSNEQQYASLSGINRSLLNFSIAPNYSIALFFIFHFLFCYSSCWLELFQF